MRRCSCFWLERRRISTVAKLATCARSRFLLTRGAILVLLEMTVIRLSWTFDITSITFQLAGVIWMLGWCMVLMSCLAASDALAVGESSSLRRRTC